MSSGFEIIGGFQFQRKFILTLGTKQQKMQRYFKDDNEIFTTDSNR